MLVLTRKLNECIHIGDGVQITIVEIHGQQIRIGINAPKSVPVLRGELMWRDKITPAKATPSVLALPDTRTASEKRK